MKEFLGCLGILVVGFIVITLISIASFLGMYNIVLSMDEAVHSQWAQVDNQLQRRYDLIPNLVETVKGTALQEQQVFLGIAEARKAYFQAQNPNDKAVAAGNIESALSRLLVLKEEYPQLKSNEAFMKLQDSVEGSENRLAVERGKYNKAVQNLNYSIRSFPMSFIARFAGVSPAEYFKVADEAKAVPKVNFNFKESK
jgi:LemA protein